MAEGDSPRAYSLERALRISDDTTRTKKKITKRGTPTGNF